MSVRTQNLVFVGFLLVLVLIGTVVVIGVVSEWSYSAEERANGLHCESHARNRFEERLPYRVDTLRFTAPSATSRAEHGAAFSVVAFYQVDGTDGTSRTHVETAILGSDCTWIGLVGKGT